MNSPEYDNILLSLKKHQDNVAMFLFNLDKDFKIASLIQKYNLTGILNENMSEATAFSFLLRTIKNLYRIAIEDR